MHIHICIIKPTQTTVLTPSVVNPVAAFRTGTTPVLASSVNAFPISQTLGVTNPGPQHYPNATGRPTLTGGFAGGRVSGMGILRVMRVSDYLLMYHFFRYTGTDCTD